MSYPNFSNKHSEPSAIQPQQYLNYMKGRGKYPSRPAPKAVVLCYQPGLLSFIRENHPTQSCDGFLSRLLFLTETHNRIAVMGGFGIGSPAAAAHLEELIAFGVSEFISVGSAGSLQPHISIGDKVLCDRAIRDEGTSHHYLRNGKYSYPSKRLTERLSKALNIVAGSLHVGTTWTIDAPYRETVTEVKHYQQEGVATVDMEASALFAVAQYRKVDMASVFTISDSLADLKWQPYFHSSKTQQGLEDIYRAAIASFSLI